MAKSFPAYRRDDFEAGVRAAWLDQIGHKIADLRNTEDGSASELRDDACPKCHGALESVTIDYEANSSAGNRLVKPIPADRCPGCSTVFVRQMFADDLDEFIVSVPNDLKIIPEVGIQTSEGIEVFVRAVSGDSGTGYECEVESEVIAGLRISVGAQSEFALAPWADTNS